MKDDIGEAMSRTPEGIEITSETVVVHGQPYVEFTLPVSIGIDRRALVEAAEDPDKVPAVVSPAQQLAEHNLSELRGELGEQTVNAFLLAVLDEVDRLRAEAGIS